MTKKRWDAIWVNATVATCVKDSQILLSGAIAVNEDRIAWVGSMNDLNEPPELLADKVYDVAGLTITPGLIDCHTHLIYAGNRAEEFAQRAQGMTYEEIAKLGGGIQSTVRQTRLASEDELFAQSLPRAQAIVASGVTTLEIKSGYGLELATEIKMLRVAKRIAQVLPITLKTTLLAAHVIAPEYQARPKEYVDLICHEMIPLVATEKLADAVDVFCEKIAFNLQQTEKIFAAAKRYHLAVKCHAEQLSDSGAGRLAAMHQAVSADHLEYASPATIEAMANAATVAVLLPGAFYFLRETKLPPIELLRKHQVPIALATDCNPGTSPIMSLPLVMNLACTLYRLTPEEALHGVTRNAAAALGLQESIGTLEVGKMADFLVWNVNHPTLLSYYAGWNPLQQYIKSGRIIN